jgi:hypothetical protein
MPLSSNLPLPGKMPLVSGYRQHVKLGVSQIVERLGSTDDEKQG